ncbi:HEAT repeat domain-containing protein [Candidatus Poribacteria bacterium]|nr:HEAT repeat domain-containing protein [Candidatus Poribacteria bacterium]
MPQLLPLLRDTDSSVRWSAAGVLGRIGSSQAEVVVPQLLPLLRDKNSSVRRAAAHALERIGGSQAEVVVPQLLPLLRDKDSDVQQAAADALDKMWLITSARQTNAGQPVYAFLLHRMKGKEARLDARYREAVVHALARWYNMGLPQEKTETAAQTEETTDKAEPPDPRAQDEHTALQQELERLSNTERRLWLRAAACEVWVTAYRLRSASN